MPRFFPVYGVYQRNQWTGKVYWNQNVLNYSNEDFTGNINVEVVRRKLLASHVVIVDWGEMESSFISGEEVFIGILESEIYMVQTEYKGVGFIFTGKGLSQEEMIAVIMFHSEVERTDDILDTIRLTFL